MIDGEKEQITDEKKDGSQIYKRIIQLGKGANGEVFGVQPENLCSDTPSSLIQKDRKKSKNQNIKNKISLIRNHKKSTYAVEKDIPKSKYREIEHQITSKWFFTQPHKQHSGYVSFITEYIPGKNLTKLSSSEEFQELTISDRVSLALQLVDQVCSRHANKPSTGPANYHADIHSGNIIIDLSEPGKPKLTLFDHGQSNYLTEAQIENPNKLEKFIYDSGNAITSAPEVVSDQKIKAQYGTKSDIFMVTAPLLQIFGVHDPFSVKKLLSDPKQKSKAPFSQYGIIEFPDLDLYDSNLNTIFKKFINRMQITEVEKRPDDEELLRFFTDLQKLIKLHEKYKYFSIKSNIFGISAALVMVGLASGFSSNSNTMLKSFDSLGIIAPYTILLSFFIAMGILTAFYSKKKSMIDFRNEAMPIIEQLKSLANGTYYADPKEKKIETIPFTEEELALGLDKAIQNQEKNYLLPENYFMDEKRKRKQLKPPEPTKPRTIEEEPITESEQQKPSLL